MTEFKIGDVVRFKEDKEGDINVIVKAIDGYLLCVSACGERWVRATSFGVELVHRPDPQADIKQAIREVLLSVEFMEAFAAAWMKTPLPIAMQNESRHEIINAKDLAMWGISEPATEATNDPT